MPHRYFTTEIGQGRAALTGSDAHHLADVMRASVGDQVILCDPHAVEYLGTVTAIAPGRVEFSVTEGYPSAAEPDVEVTLFAGYPKLGKLEDTIRSFQAILGGEVDDLPEQAFMLCGSIDDVIAKRGTF